MNDDGMEALEDFSDEKDILFLNLSTCRKIKVQTDSKLDSWDWLVYQRRGTNWDSLN